jgi:hypothetical protein
MLAVANEFCMLYWCNIIRADEAAIRLIHHILSGLWCILLGIPPLSLFFGDEMKTIVIWLLISVYHGDYIRSNDIVTVVERFPTVEDCQHVLQSVPSKDTNLRCVQANVVREK